MAGHALPPPAPVKTGPTMRVTANGRQAIQSLKAAKTLSWPSSPPFFFPNELQPPAQESSLYLENKGKWLYKAPQAPALYMDKHLKLASPNTTSHLFAGPADKTSETNKSGSKIEQSNQIS
ncbi:hypothetical protein CMV_000883 [Castanea mollissima]|uniref:Uncharacterized protein n=1 Tax=Castanea mollissima TaxID=60419 RepID=A0A8J4RWH8_9ROSI|nr:hypothetical protein CMV_000883 [Castanea mollissima]